MTAAGLLERLHAKGIALSLDGGDIVYEGPPEVLSDKVLDAIREAKPALLKLLALEIPADPPPAPAADPRTATQSAASQHQVVLRSLRSFNFCSC